MEQPIRRRGRPKKSPETNNVDTRAILLKAGLKWLTTSGFSQTSLDNILHSAQVPKGSFYHYFANKEAFGLTVLAEYRLYFEKKLLRHFNDTAYLPLTRLTHFIEDACQGMARHNFSRGCLVGNLEQEALQLSITFRPAIIATYNSWQQLLADCLSQAKSHEQIPQDIDVEHVAKMFWIGWEGAVSRARLLSNDQPLRQYGSYFLQQLNP